MESADIVKIKDSEYLKLVCHNRNAETYQKEALPKKSDELGENDVKAAIAHVNKSLVSSRRELHYSVHDATNRIMVKIIDSDTKEVIREIPQERTLDMLAKVLELTGVLVDKKT